MNYWHLHRRFLQIRATHTKSVWWCTVLQVRGETVFGFGKIVSLNRWIYSVSHIKELRLKYFWKSLRFLQSCVISCVSFCAETFDNVFFQFVCQHQILNGHSLARNPRHTYFNSQWKWNPVFKSVTLLWRTRSGTEPGNASASSVLRNVDVDGPRCDVSRTEVN